MLAFCRSLSANQAAANNAALASARTHGLDVTASRTTDDVERALQVAQAAFQISRLGERFLQCVNYSDRLAQEEIIKASHNDTIITRQPRRVAALVVP